MCRPPLAGHRTWRKEDRYRVEAQLGWGTGRTPQAAGLGWLVWGRAVERVRCWRALAATRAVRGKVLRGSPRVKVRLVAAQVLPLADWLAAFPPAKAPSWVGGGALAPGTLAAGVARSPAESSAAHQVGNPLLDCGWVVQRVTVELT